MSLQCTKITYAFGKLMPFVRTTNTPAVMLVSLWGEWIIILKRFRMDVNHPAICLMFVSSSAEMIWKADVLLLKNLRYTSNLPYCLYLQMKLELPPIVLLLCPIVPNWRILYSLLISNEATAFSRWNCFSNWEMAEIQRLLSPHPFLTVLHGRIFCIVDTLSEVFALISH